MLLLSLSRPRLHLLLPEIRLPIAHSCFRDRLGGLWICAELDRFHCWKGDTGRGNRRHDEWRYDTDDQCPPAGKETGMDGRRGSHDGNRERGRSVARRSADDERQLAVVFLQ